MRLARSPQAHPRPALPTVNLLSPSAFERIAVRRLRRRLVAAGVALVLLVAAGWTAQHLRVGQAEDLLAVEQAETTRLTAETRALAPVRAFVSGVLQQQATVDATMAREIYFSRVVDGLRAATPSAARLDSVAVTLAPEPVPAADGAAAVPTVSPCPGPDPFSTRTVVGCVVLSGTADSRAVVSDLVIALGGSRLFVEPFVSTTTTADSAEVTFSGSVGLSERVFSGRYAR